MKKHTYKSYIRKIFRIVEFLTAIILLSFLVYTFCIRFFSIRDIQIIGDNVSLQFDPKIVSHNLLFFPAEKYRNIILNEYPQIENVIIRKKFPRTLIIEVILRQPFAVIKTDTAFYQVDTNGYIVGYPDSVDSGNPVIYIPGIRISGSQRIENPVVITMLRFLSLISPEIPIERITINRDGSIQAVSGKSDIFLPQETDTDSIAATLQTLFRGFRMKGTMPATVDLRYSKPIVTF
jgi:hypothetical protein